MPWWGWIVVGVVLLAAELTVVDAEFYLVFLGISALAVGLLEIAGVDAPMWAEWASFGVLAAGSMVFFRRRVYDKLRASPSDPQHALIGEIAVIRGTIAAGAQGEAELRGTSWTVHNTSAGPLEAGARAEVVAAHGVVLDVRPAASRPS